MHRIDVEGPLDLPGTLGLLSSGFGDPTLRVSPRGFLRASRTPEGPATVHAVREGEGQLRLRTWGPGSEWAVANVPDLLGQNDTAPASSDLPATLRGLAHRARGVRLGRTHRVVELLTLIVLQQKVTGKEAARAHRNLIRRFSERAPGPFDDLLLPLGAKQLRGLPLGALLPLGVPARQAETLVSIGWHASRLEETAGMPSDDAARRLGQVRGLGPWSVASALLRGMGDADAVPLGDYHLPSTVAFNLAGEERADDERMLALLEPYRGQRGRVIRWIHAAGRMAPRRGPRMPIRALPT